MVIAPFAMGRLNVNFVLYLIFVQWRIAGPFVEVLIHVAVIPTTGRLVVNVSVIF